MCDRDAERAVLGTCLLGKAELVAACRELLPPGAFYVPKHGHLWRVILSLHDEGIPVDPVSVIDRAAKMIPRWSVPEDPLFVNGLYAQAPLTANPYHARVVAKWARVRTVVEAGTRLVNIGGKADLDRLDDMVEQARTALNEAAVVGTTRAPWHDRLVDGATFALDMGERIPALWGNDTGSVLWAQGESLMLVGPPGVGKSTVAGQLVAARLGLPGRQSVLGFPVTPGRGRVLYIAGDRPRQIARSLRRTMDRPDWRDVLKEVLVVWQGPPPYDFARRPETLLEMARDAEADTVVLDSLKDMAVGLTEDTPAAQYNKARQLALANGIELLELHHQVKRGPRGEMPNTIADVYGSGIHLTGGAGSVVLLWGQPGDPIVTLTHLKQPEQDVGPLKITHDHVRGESAVTQGVDLVLLAAHSPAGITARDAAERIHDKKKLTPSEVQKARHRLNMLVESGQLIAARGRSGDPSNPITYHAAAQEEEEGS
jgi:replicative DNA helicase